MPQLPDGGGPGFQALRDRVQTALLLDSESPSVNFKGGAAWSALKITIVKSVLAMSNLSDGGLIIIGHPQDGAISPGVSERDLATYDPDVMRDKIDEYASPRAIITMAQFELSGHKYIGIKVEEFEELPVVCKKDHERELRKGGVYIRPYTARPRSTIVTSAEEMRDVLELAIDKGITTFEARAARRGFGRNATDAAAYAAEAGDLDDA